MNKRDYWLAAGICAVTWATFTAWAYWYLLRVAG